MTFHGPAFLHRAQHPGGAPASAGVHLHLVLAATAIAMFAVNLDFFALNLSVPGMADDLGVSTTDMQWAVSGYMLALGAFLIPGGRLGDIVGRRRMLVAGLAIFGAASLASGLAPSAEVMIGFRIVQGLGAAILFPLCIAVVSNAFPESGRKRAIGNLYGLAAVATALGPFVGGFLTGVLSWRWVLLVNVPVVIAAIVLTLRAVPESRDENVPRAIDFKGLSCVVLGIGALSYAVDKGDAWGWSSGRTLGVLAAGAALLAVFVLIERRVRWPLVDLALFRNVPYVAITLLAMTANIVFVATTFASTLYLQDVRGYSPTEAGLAFLAASATLGVAGPLSGRLAEKLDVPRLMAVAIGVGAIGLLAVSADPALAVYLPGLAVFGIGYGLCWSMASVGTQSVVSTARAGEASGVTLAIVVGVAGLCVALTASLIEVLAGGGAGEGEAVEEILRVMAIASIVIAVPLALLGSRKRVDRRVASAR
jgi:EmrB/QacA subfamily drug resistance transporter